MIVLFPSFQFLFPEILTLALSLFAIALTFNPVILFFTFIEYVLTLLLNPGINVYPLTSKDFSVASLLFTVEPSRSIFIL